MGKFGKFKLPEFVLKKFGPEITDDENTTLIEERLSDEEISNFKTLSQVGLMNNAKPMEPKVLKIYANNPTDIAEIQAAGHKARKLLPSEIWAKIQTVYGEEVILQFEADDEYVYRDGNATAYHENWMYKIPIRLYDPEHKSSSIEEMEPENIDAEEIQSSHKYYEKPGKVQMTPARRQREVEYKDPENYYKKVFDKIIELWKSGDKRPIKFNAYRENFTITDPLTQLDPSTGEVTSDSGERIPFDDTGAIQIGEYHGVETDSEDQKKKYSMTTHYHGPTALGYAAYHENHKVFESFQDFQSHVAETPIGEDEDAEEVNEEDMIRKQPKEMAQPCEGCSDHPDTLSENAKNAIKQICNEILIKEAHIYETSEDPNQTYETFLKECTHYMAECLIRASQNLKV